MSVYIDVIVVVNDSCSPLVVGLPSPNTVLMELIALLIVVKLPSILVNPKLSLSIVTFGSTLILVEILSMAL